MKFKMLHDSFTKTSTQLADYYKADLSLGLSQQEADIRLAKYGANELPREEGTPLWKLVLEQFDDQLVQILLLAAAISFVLAVLEKGDGRFAAFVEPLVILLILIANAIVGVVQESNAEKAIEALRSYAPDEAKVIRDGNILRIEASQLVPGDLVEVAVGDRIPADLRIIELVSTHLRADQAILTGESVSVAKTCNVVSDPQAVKQDQINMLFAGTTITFGRARGLVVLTGSNTAMGAIQVDISESGNKDTPLKKRLDEFGDSLAKIITVICILVWIINIRHFTNPIHGGVLKGAIYYFKIAVALAVAAIPEGLAVVITTCLALGTRKMAKKNAIVRYLPSVETLGCTSVICSDKTGTLTTNQMSVTHILLAKDSTGELAEFDVEGTTFEPHGSIRKDGIVLEESKLAIESTLSHVGLVCALCNDAAITYDPKIDGYACLGEATEGALKTLAEKLKTPDSNLNHKIPLLSKKDCANFCSRYWEENMYTKLLTFEFDRNRKSMSVLVQDQTTKSNLLLVKGAPESILDRCNRVKLRDGNIVSLTSQIKKSLMDRFERFGEREALRVLALAIIPQANSAKTFEGLEPTAFASIEQDMVFIGLVAMLDPPRPEVAASIEKCRDAGIKVVVITGDNKKTAEAICRKVGIFDSCQDVTNCAMTGREFDSLSKADQLKAIQTVKLFARTEPKHKSRLVQLFQEQGAVVAMTGDGVNDAPALKRADIGIAMGKTGTDVAKLAADMVLADDNFATIVSAVEEGRSIYNNTKQFIRYLISSNIGEVVSIFLTVLLGMPEALIPVQLLWVNLVTDGLPATALGFNPPDHHVMRMPPRSSTEPIVGRWLLIRYLIIGSYVGMATVFGYAWWYMFYSNGPQISFYQLSHYTQCGKMVPCGLFGGDSARQASTVSLSILVVIEMFNALNSLSENESLFTLPPWTNPSLIFATSLSMILHFAILYIPLLSSLFSVGPLGREEWLAVVFISLPVIFIDEILKCLSRMWIKDLSAVSKQKQD